MVTSIIAKTAIATPILFLILNFSLKKNRPTKVDTTTIATLLIVNKVELSKFLFCKAFIRNIIE